MVESIKEDSLAINFAQVAGYIVASLIFSVIIPYILLGGSAILQSTQNVIKFAFHVGADAMALLGIGFLQLTEKSREKTNARFFNSFIHDPSKSLLYQLSGKKLPSGFTIFLKSLFYTIWISIGITLFLGLAVTLSAVQGLNTQYIHYDKVQDNLGAVYLAGEPAGGSESNILSNFIPASIYGVGLALARKSKFPKAWIIGFFIIALVLSTLIAVVYHNAIYQGDEAILTKVGILFAIENSANLLTGSGFPSWIIHSGLNMLTEASVLFGFDRTVPLLIGVMLFGWVLTFGAYLALTWKKKQGVPG